MTQSAVCLAFQARVHLGVMVSHEKPTPRQIQADVSLEGATVPDTGTKHLKYRVLEVVDSLGEGGAAQVNNFFGLDNKPPLQSAEEAQAHCNFLAALQQITQDQTNLDSLTEEGPLAGLFDHPPTSEVDPDLLRQLMGYGTDNKNSHSE
jgi:hypothetical protein